MGLIINKSADNIHRQSSEQLTAKASLTTTDDEFNEQKQHETNLNNLIATEVLSDENTNDENLNESDLKSTKSMTFIDTPNQLKITRDSRELRDLRTQSTATSKIELETLSTQTSEVKLNEIEEISKKSSEEILDEMQENEVGEKEESTEVVGEEENDQRDLMSEKLEFPDCTFHDLENVSFDSQENISQITLFCVLGHFYQLRIPEKVMKNSGESPFSVTIREKALLMRKNSVLLIMKKQKRVF